MSTKSQYEAHAGAGDVGEGYKEPQGGPRYEEGKDNSHQALDSTDERSIANKVSNFQKTYLIPFLCSTHLSTTPSSFANDVHRKLTFLSLDSRDV